MAEKDLLNIIKDSSLMKKIQAQLNDNQGIGLESAPFSARVLIAAALDGPKIIITTENKREILKRAMQSMNYREDFISLAPSDNPNYPRDFKPIESSDNQRVFDPSSVNSRIRALEIMAENKDFQLIFSGQSFAQNIPLPTDISKFSQKLKPGLTINRENLLNKLIEFGYNRQSLVDRPGSFAIRGEIVDIFPYDDEYPARIIFFDDEIETLRKFDPYSQRSQEKIELLTVYSARGLDGTIDKGDYNSGKFSNSFFPYIPENAVLVLDDDMAIFEEIDQYSKAEGNAGFLRYFAGEITKFRQVAFLSIGSPQRLLSRIKMKGHEISNFSRNFQEMEGQLKNLKKKAKNIVITSESTIQALRIKKILSELELSSHLVSKNHRTVREKIINIHIGHYGPGFFMEDFSLALISEDDLFGQKVRLPEKRERTLEDTLPIAHFTDIEEDELIVHIDHGIGVYKGLKTLTVEGKKRDFLELAYGGGDKLFVPVDKVHFVQRYIGSDEKPTLNRLSGTKWQNARARAKKAAEKIAVELVKLYSERAATKGHSFGPDTVWQQELEASFPFQETEDQLIAIDQVKRDMEDSKPMDRLICGDVGYGKTEVAIRAAFKAVMEGKQVAILCPTTLLASQLHIVFTERMGPFAVKVELLSRFKTVAQSNEIIQRLKDGACDVVVGTHKLLSDKVNFKDLGLLIIDEEHRFGVKHKEKLKSLKKQVDILSMTATPIPRTLHMSLSGVRDMSIINTPPHSRLPIKTRVAPISREVVASAIRAELERDGQVFFVHNRVETIENALATVKSWVPEAQAKAAHGQMDKAKLEKIMMDFLDRKINVLVCSAIIESGLDIPVANTIIISRADAFGLAQLYQLRGRVGRSNTQAFALLLVPEHGFTTKTARERLETIDQYTELGSGFKIAMKDLELRGAGNILGFQQHGQIGAVGFELYCQILKKAIEEISDFPISGPEEKPDGVEVALDMEAHIPDSYVANPPEKINIYRRLIQCEKVGAVQELEDELEDRFGLLPESTKNLLGIQKLRIAAAPKGVEKIGKMGKFLRISFKDSSYINEKRILSLSKKYDRLALLPENPPIIRVFHPRHLGLPLLKWLEELIQDMTTAHRKSPL